MAIKVGGTTVIDDSRNVDNIGTIKGLSYPSADGAAGQFLKTDGAGNLAFQTVQTDPTLGTLTKSFTSGETASITLAQAISPAPVVSATKEVAQAGISSKGTWDVNATASNYELHNTAYDTTLTPSITPVSDISQATYASKTTGNLGFSLPRGLWFKPDGTTMYVLDHVNAQIVVRTLSTAWDVSTSTYSTAYTFTVGISTASGTQPMNFWFNSSGTSLYVTHVTGVYEHTLSTAWDVSTISYVAGSNFYTGNFDSNTRGFWWKPDGTKMYVVGTTNDTVYESHFSTAFDFTTGSQFSPSASFSVASQASSPRDVQFNSSGTIMYITDDGGSVYEYSLSTAWDVTSASYTGNSLSVSAQDSQPQAIYFGDGNLYVMGDQNREVYQYNFSSAAIALGTGSFATTDVGKRIVGNGGDVTLTSTAGAYDTTGGSAFTDSSTIASGSWSMRGLKSAGDADGIGFAGVAQPGTLSTVDVFSDSSAISLHTLDNTLHDAGGSYNASGSSAFSSTVKKYGTHSWTAGSGNDFTIPYNQPNNGAWSVSFWFRLHTTGFLSPNNRMVDFKEHVSSRGTTIVWESDNQFHFILRNNEGGYGGIPLGNVTDGSWHHIVCGSVNGTGQRPFLFVDGTEITTRNSQNRSDSHEQNGILFGTGYGGHVSNSTYDQVRIFNKNLSASEVATLYAETANIFVLPTSQYHIATTNSGGQIDTSNWLDINTMVADQAAGDGTVHYAVSTDDRTTWSVIKEGSGVRPIVRDNSGTWQYNSDAGTTVGGSLTNGSFVSEDTTTFSSKSVADAFWGDSGNHLFILNNSGDTVLKYSVSTSYDFSTINATPVQTFSVSAQEIYLTSMWFSPDGLHMYIGGNQGNDVNEYTLTSAWDLSTASFTRNTLSAGNVGAISLSSDGTIIHTYRYDSNSVGQATLSTAWNTSTAGSVSYYTLPSATYVGSVFWASNGYTLYVGDPSQDVIHKYTVSTAYDLSSTLTRTETLDVSAKTSVPSGMVFNSDLSKLYIMSSSNAYTYNTTQSSYGTSTTWTNATTNDEFYALQQALGYNAFNRMDKTQLDAVTDPNHYTLGDTLDLAIALRMDTASASTPTADGVTINYDAASLNQGAVLGTDYDYDFPDSTTVRVTSNAAQNLKVRVV